MPSLFRHCKQATCRTDKSWTHLGWSYLMSTDYGAPKTVTTACSTIQWIYHVHMYYFVCMYYACMYVCMYYGCTYVCIMHACNMSICIRLYVCIMHVCSCVGATLGQSWSYYLQAWCTLIIEWIEGIYWSQHKAATSIPSQSPWPQAETQCSLPLMWPICL